MVMPYLSALAEFRKAVREIARNQKCNEILDLCDALRDDILPNLGVRLEDKESAATSIKLVDRETLLRERDAKKQAEAAKLAQKEKKRQEAAAAAAATEAQRKINPKGMFLNETDKYSTFDERVSRDPDTKKYTSTFPIVGSNALNSLFFIQLQGIPTLDVKGEKVSKSLVKKLEKLQLAQEKKYTEYLASQNSS